MTPTKKKILLLIFVIIVWKKFHSLESIFKSANVKIFDSSTYILDNRSLNNNDRVANINDGNPNNNDNVPKNNNRMLNNNGITRIFYNRIPKTGSSFFKTLLKPRLSKRNNFVYIEDENSLLVKKKISGLSTQKALIEKTLGRLNQTQNSIFVQHVPFFKLDLQNLHYINLMRDPVRRVQSSYCYKRDLTKDLGRQQYRAIINKSNKAYANKWLKLPLSNCLRTRELNSCISPTTLFQGVKFFCGIQDPICDSPNTDAALAKAKYNMDKYYTVVGVLEQTRKFLAVLDHKIPAFFRGAIEVWEEMKNQEQDLSNKCLADLPPVTEEDREVIKNVLRREYELYDYAEKKLDALYYSFTSNL